MSDFLLVLATFLLATVVLGLIRILRGPTRADRMVAGQLCGTTALAVLLLLAEAVEIVALYDVALVSASLGAVAAVAFVRCVWTP